MKIAIVTAGNKGIGLEITKTLLENNYEVVVGGRSEYIDEKTQNKVHFIKGDLTKLNSHQKLVEKALQLNKEIDLYVNNVGLSYWNPIEKIDEIFLDKIIKTNLYSVFWGCKSCVKYMSPNSSIINISSIASKRGSKNNSVYVSTKFAMNGLTQSLAKELGNRNIRVNAICPVLIKTDGLIEALKNEYSPAYLNLDNFFEEFIKNQTALGRLPTAKEVAEMVVFLASKKASAITGQCINVDCGVFPQ